MRLPTVRIADDRFVGGWRVVNESDFDPEVHTRWEDAQEQQDPEADQDPEGELPEGYRVSNAGGPYLVLRDPSGAVVEGPSNGKWRGRTAALEAAHAHAGESA